MVSAVLRQFFQQIRGVLIAGHALREAIRVGDFVGKLDLDKDTNFPWIMNFFYGKTRRV